MARPRIHAAGTTASDRRRISETARREAGSARKTIILSAEALAAIAILQQHWQLSSETATIEQALLAGLEKLSQDR